MDKYIENLKIKKEDLKQQRKKLSNIFFIVTVLLNAILFYVFYFYYLKKINEKINSLCIDLKNIELEKEKENKKAEKIKNEIEHYFNKEW